MANRRVVITGIGIICAAGLGIDEFFSNLSNGKTGIGPIRRFDTTPLATKQGGEVDLLSLLIPPALSDRPPWNPVQDMKAILAWNALKQIDQNIPSDAAFFCAVGLERVDVDALIRNDSNASMVCPEVPPTLLPGVLWRILRKTGPVAAQVTACAAGTLAIGAATRTIRHGRFDCVVAGGVDSLIFPYGIHAFNSLEALSERNDLGPWALAPFDLNRSGTLLGEGAAFLILEEASCAKKRGAKPLAEIIGYGCSMDAYHPVMPRPDGGGAIAAMEAAIKDAQLLPSQIEYVNAHGTGTIQNDSMEVRAILSVFGEHGKKLPVSSIKPFVGHLLSASGAVEAVSALMPFFQDILPPTLHFKTPDPDCPVDCIPNQARSAHLTRVMTNSYGLGGQNASLIFSRI